MLEKRGNKEEKVVTPLIEEVADLGFKYGDKFHRVFKDEAGSLYVEIFSNIKLQKFLSDFLKELGFLTSEITSKSENGKETFLSKVPNEKDYNYALNGKIKGFAQILIMDALISEHDKTFYKTRDTVFRGKTAHNLNIVLGNFIFYDLESASSLSPNRTKEEILSDIRDKLDIMLEDVEFESIKDYPSRDRYLEEVFIYAFSEVERLLKLIVEDGPQILERNLAKHNIGYMVELFPLLNSDTSIFDFCELLLKRLIIFREFLVQKLNE